LQESKFHPRPDAPGDGLFYKQCRSLEKDRAECWRRGVLRAETIRVLIVDDQPQVREGLAAVLGLSGGAAHPAVLVAGEASNGLEAVQQARLLRPDVVLLDLEMPVMDGCAAARLIKQDAPTTWIVALTIHGAAETRQKAAGAGVDVFLEKGGPLQELLAAIRSSGAAGY
jgi:DNA-binding NarL/FixJ family response regulator